MKTNFKFKTQLIACAYVLLAVVFLVGCEDENIPKKKIKDVFAFSNVEVVEIDSCEYIYVPNGNASWGAHKGNCKFCLARRSK
jgi:hypothetical protein